MKSNFCILKGALSPFLMCLFLCLFSFSNIQAAKELDKSDFGSGEDAAIQTALGQFINNGLSVSGLQVEIDGQGAKTVLGNISLLGSDNVSLQAALNANSDVQSISIIFPPSLSISLSQLDGFLGGASLSTSLPPGFPTDTGLALSSMELSFSENGSTLERFEVIMDVGSYQIPGFDGFAIQGIDLSMHADNPTNSNRLVGGTMTGQGQLGAIPFELNASLGSSPELLVFSGTAENISIETILNSFASSSDANTILRLIPGPIKDLAINSLTTEFNPASRSFSGLGESTMGIVELKFTGAKDGQKAGMQLGLAPPNSFQFSDISGALAPLDAVNLSETNLVISSIGGGELSSNLPGLEGEDISLIKGINVLSKIAFSEDLANFLKVNQLNIRGSINSSFTGINLKAGLDLNLNFSEKVSMEEVEFGINFGPGIPLEFSVAGKLEAEIEGDKLGFQAGFRFSPIEQQISGEFFMRALEKDGVVTEGDTPPEWTEPFGIPGIGIRGLGASVGIDLKFAPIFLNQLGLTGAARIGTVADQSKHIQGDVTAVINVTTPTRSILDVAVENLKINQVIGAFLEDFNPDGILGDMLDTGLDSGRVRVVPVDGLEAFGKIYERGVAFSAAISLIGLNGNIDFAVNDSGVKGSGALDAISWGNGLFELSGTSGSSSKPQFNLVLQPGVPPLIQVDGRVSILGISREVSIFFDADQFRFMTAGKFADAFEVIFEVEGTSFSQIGNPGLRVRAALRNDLVQRLNEEITGAIDQATADVRSTLQANRRKLEEARAVYDEIDGRIEKRRGEILTRRQADLRKMREEAERARRDAQSTLNWHRSKIRNINARLRELDGGNPFDWPEIGVQEAAKLFHEGAIEVEKLAVEAYAETVNGLADVGEEFPVEIELADLYAERAAATVGVETAILGLDIAEGVSTTALEAGKWIVDQALGGIFDIRSAEFEGVFGLQNQNRISVNFNVTFARQPYHFTAEIDFDNVSASVGGLVGRLISGDLLRPGFKPTFGAELQLPPNVQLASAPVLMNYSEKPVTRPVFNYYVTVDTPEEPTAGSNEKFEITLIGENGRIERRPLTKDQFTGFSANKRETFPISSSKNIGTITRVAINPIRSTLSDNLIIKGVSIQTSYDPTLKHGECNNCSFNTGNTSKTISFDGKEYADYWLTISTSNAEHAGTDENVSIQLVGEGKSTDFVLLNTLVKENAFERNDLTEIPLSIEDIGAIQSINLKVSPKVPPFTDEWGFSGITIRDAEGNVQVNYCNCTLTNTNKSLDLHDPDFYEDYQLQVKTKDGGIFDGFGTDSKISMQIVGDNGATTEWMLLQKVLRSEEGLFGLENLFEMGNTDRGFITIQDFNCLTSFNLEFNEIGILDDDWTPESIRIFNNKQEYVAQGLSEFTRDTIRNIRLVPQNTRPSIKCPKSIIVDSDPNRCGAIVQYDAPINLDNCSGLPLRQRRIAGQASGSVFPIGVTTNRFQVEDTQSRRASCQFTVTVNYKSVPRVSCPANITKVSDPGQCGAIVNFNASASTTCEELPISFSRTSGSMFPIGTTTVSVATSDTLGNVANCQFNVTVTDRQPLAISCPANQTVNVTPGTCQATVRYDNPVVTDNCPGARSRFVSGIRSRQSFPLGLTTVRYEATNPKGETKNCSFRIEVVDNEGPTMRCAESVVVNNQSGTDQARVSFNSTATDPCDGNLTVSHDKASGSSFPIGTTVVTASARDGAGNSSSCQFTVTVKDVEAPTIQCPLNQIVSSNENSCGGETTFLLPQVSDNSDQIVMTQLSGLSSGQRFPLGVTTNTYQVVDSGDNEATCSFTIEVIDETSPNIICPANIRVFTGPDACASQVSFNAPAVSDNCSVNQPEQTGGLTSGAVFPLGVTTINFSVTDQAGLSANCSFNVEVIDDIDPAITCPANIRVATDPNNCTAVVNFDTPVGTDNCSGANTSQIAGMATTSAFPIGITTNTFEVVDEANRRSACSFTVEVVDEQGPAISCPANIRVTTDNDQCTAVVNYATPVGTDNCSGAVTELIEGLASGSAFPIGLTSLGYEVVDGVGLKADCAFTIEVVDEQVPNITCPPNQTQSCELPNTPDLMGEPTTSDNCGVAGFEHQDAITAGNCPGNFSIARTWTVEDIHGNSNSCQQIVTVEDVTPPVISCPENLTVFCNIDPNTSTGLATATDNCDANLDISFTDNIALEDCFWSCTIERNWLAVDDCGNTSNCIQTINRNTILLIEEALSKDLNGDGQADTLVVGQDRNTFSVPPGSGNCFPGWYPELSDEPKALSRGRHLPDDNCSHNAVGGAAAGKLGNPLLAAVIQLDIMIRLEPGLANTRLNSLSCEIPGIINQNLSDNPSIQDLLDLSNRALANRVLQQNLGTLLEVLSCVNNGSLNVCR